MRWDWKRLAASGPQALEYDESHEANFTYWDNSTLFAAAVRERGVRAQRHTRQLADSSAFAALALGGERWVRYGGSLRAFSQGLADELQAGGKAAAGAPARVAPAACGRTGLPYRSSVLRVPKLRTRVRFSSPAQMGSGAPNWGFAKQRWLRLALYAQ